MMTITKTYETIAMNQKFKNHCNVVCRDVSKAFDKVWHRGLQFKLTQREIPSTIVKILSSYLVNRTGQIKFNGKIGPKFNIKSGVPQGGILSPTMYIFYTADMPRAGAGATDVMFADDVTQIVENHDNNREQLARDTERER